MDMPRNLTDNVFSTNEILEIVSNETRRKILYILSEEPMYLNQLSRKIDIGQQAILRHINLLERTGLIEGYYVKSELGAPDRKYYKVRSSFNMYIHLSQDLFSIRNERPGDHNSRLDDLLVSEIKDLAGDNSDGNDDNGDNLTFTQQIDIMYKLEQKIIFHMQKLNELYSFKQLLLKKFHEICQNKDFDILERVLLYKIIQFSPDTLDDLVSMVNENSQKVNDAIIRLYSKLDEEDASQLLSKFRQSPKY